jgi:hypothetical protein
MMKVVSSITYFKHPAARQTLAVQAAQDTVLWASAEAITTTPTMRSTNLATPRSTHSIPPTSKYEANTSSRMKRMEILEVLSNFEKSKRAI